MEGTKAMPVAARAARMMARNCMVLNCVDRARHTKGRPGAE